MFELVFSIIGIAMCLMVILQLFHWSANLTLLSRHNRKQFELHQESLRRKLDQKQVTEDLEKVTPEGGWKGFRDFEVVRLIPETTNCTSVYLKPLDGKPIIGFQPGQHLPIQFDIPEQSKPIVRCYSLSCGPTDQYYRISVKRCPPAQPTLPPGQVSHFVNDRLQVGDRVRCKPPAGSFFLDESSSQPAVLMAGGIGVTPLLSMIEHELAKDSDRLMLLIYGVRNRADHAFREHLASLARQNQHRMQVITLYSNPEPEDKKGEDYQLEGRLSIELLQRLLPHSRCQFYLCGPPGFMKSLYPAMLEWGVEESNIFFESFGPASIKRSKRKVAASSSAAAEQSLVEFSLSAQTYHFTGGVESILELAEAQGIEIDSSCRAGSCGTCETRLLSGRVLYPEGEQPDCESGNCLPCIARPAGRVVVEA